MILGIGGLTYEKARLLAVRAGLLLLLTWGIAFAFILLMQIGFPSWESASFFSSSLVEFPPPPNFLELYIPSNPFHSLAENLIPAVVLFAIAMGIALIGFCFNTQFSVKAHEWFLYLILAGAVALRRLYLRDAVLFALRLDGVLDRLDESGTKPASAPPAPDPLPDGG